MFFGILLYLLVLGAAWLFRLAYLGWFGSFLFWVALLLPPALTLLSLPSMLSLKLGLRSPDTVSCGEEAELSLVFETPRRIPVGKVRLRIEIRNLHTGETTQSDYHFEAVARSTGVLPIPSESCGSLRIRVLSWSCSDVIDLCRLRRAVPPVQLCCVLPVPAAPESAGEEESVKDAQPRMKPKYGGGFAEDHELRVYRPGDMMNSVHWKLSGKTEDLIVREALVPENDVIYLVLQKNGSGDRGLRTLFWLSQQLNRREIAHVLVADDLYPVGDDAGTVAALKAILSKPEGPPVRTDTGDALRIYTIEGGEVRIC